MPNLIRIAFAFSVFTSLAAVAQDSRWLEIAGNDAVTTFVDTQSIRKSGKKVKVWLKWVNASPVDTDTVFPKKTFLSEKTLAIYHCSDRTSVTVQAIRYANADATGGVVETLTVEDKPANYRELAPETIGEFILNYACKVGRSNRK